MSELSASSLVLGLAWFAMVNASAGLAAWSIGSLVLSHARPARPGMLLAIRLLPAVASLAFVSVMFLPSHFRFEPADAGESFGLVIVGFAAVGAALLIRACARGISVTRIARALRRCERLTRVDAALPEGGVFEVRGMTGVSLAGVFRPRVLVGAVAARELSDAELEVAIAHELAHRGAFDNVKRFALFCAPDLFGFTAVAGSLEREWAAAAETLADDRAVDGDVNRALHLASALVKVAQLGATTRPPVASPAWSTLTDEPLLETRVRRLLGGTTTPAPRPSVSRLTAGLAMASAATVVLGTALSGSVHQLTEALVRVLP